MRAQTPRLATVDRSTAHLPEFNIDHPPESRESLSGDGSRTWLQRSHPCMGCSDRGRLARQAIQTTWTTDLTLLASRKYFTIDGPGQTPRGSWVSPEVFETEIATIQAGQRFMRPDSQAVSHDLEQIASAWAMPHPNFIPPPPKASGKGRSQVAINGREDRGSTEYCLLQVPSFSGIPWRLVRLGPTAIDLENL